MDDYFLVVITDSAKRLREGERKEQGVLKRETYVLYFPRLNHDHCQLFQYLLPLQCNLLYAMYVQNVSNVCTFINAGLEKLMTHTHTHIYRV